MALKNINPTTTSAWQKLTNHFKDIKDINITAPRSNCVLSIGRVME